MARVDEDDFESALQTLVAEAVANEIPVEGYWFIEEESSNFEVEIVSVRQDPGAISPEDA